MAQSLSQIFLHIVFSTKDRAPFIQPEVEDELYAYMAKILNDLDCHAYKIYGCKDHVHIACNLSRTITVSHLLEEVKRSSSKWIKTKGREFKNFSWQKGYGAFSFGRSQLDDVVRYIEKQKHIHEKKTFKREFLEMLEKYEVEYDEKYLWD
jgi:REP element-mobilizing transposase RayT